MRRKLKPKTKLRLLQAGGAATTFAPLALAVGINFGDYIATGRSAFGLTVGGALAVAVIVLQLLGKGKKLLGSAFVVTGVAFALLVLLEPLILNLKFLTGMAFAGEAGHALLFKKPIEAAKKACDRTEQAAVITQALHESGRV